MGHWHSNNHRQRYLTWTVILAWTVNYLNHLSPVLDSDDPPGQAI